MTELEKLKSDASGLETYDYIVNNVPECLNDMDFLSSNLSNADSTGKYLASSVKFLVSFGNEDFRPWIYRLIDATIEKDRERRYIGGLLEAVWGADYAERAEELKNTDDNFRRIYKRIYPSANAL